MRSLSSLFAFLCLTGVAFARDYAVVLTDEAPVRTARGNRALLESARATVTAAQEQVKSQLRTRGIRITGQARTLLNAVFIQLAIHK